ncbi:uncharacterized protein LY89DRAFT_183107 [Mollisia scopiformis]|uniref:Uncharacterized protein n=1 Tax=Mollisia scopiformis TaxID=149040 RepID=A0A194XTC5_MOLSC|nr:uncharacterized protein LY89DRAFT_183107 [Mollisia scopiformis]KUJ23458.1 hypothetical protein LY89DRAFT_183107 [Mollisia scopiformis]
MTIDGTVTRYDSRWNMSSSWVGQPSPRLDALWDELTPPIPRIRLTHNEMLWAGYDIHDALLLDDGDHTAILNVHHQLHCLNAIRKMTYIDYYTALGQHESHALAKNHVDHCIEMLRQSLICYADISVMPYIKDGEGHVRPDFDVAMQCRDYDRIVKWNWENIDRRPLPAPVSDE